MPFAASILDAAASAAGAQHYPKAALYVVATPIGNLADITLRAIHVLALVDAIACEDTRHSAPLLRQLGIHPKPLLALHEHNEHAAASGVLARLARDERVAYISDAGTPALSDPGAVLVAAVLAAGHRVLPVPGASSALAALSAAGDAAPGRVVFHGFLPTRARDRAVALAAIAADDATQLLFEAPHRIDALAKALAAACGTRRLTVCRELTKQFETVQPLAAEAFPAWLAADPNRSRGEFVLVVHAREASGVAAIGTEHDATLATLLAELPLRQAVGLAAQLTGAPRNALYERALALRRAGPADEAIDDDPGATDTG